MSVKRLHWHYMALLHAGCCSCMALQLLPLLHSYVFQLLTEFSFFLSLSLSSRCRLRTPHVASGCFSATFCFSSYALHKSKQQRLRKLYRLKPYKIIIISFFALPSSASSPDILPDLLSWIEEYNNQQHTLHRFVFFLFCFLFWLFVQREIDVMILWICSRVVRHLSISFEGL